MPKKLLTDLISIRLVYLDAVIMCMITIVDGIRMFGVSISYIKLKRAFSSVLLNKC